MNACSSPQALSRDAWTCGERTPIASTTFAVSRTRSLCGRRCGRVAGSRLSGAE